MDPVTAITIAQAGLSVAQMFAGGGGSVASLLALQTDMIRNISEQVTALQKSMNVVFNQVDQIKQLVRKLPSATVIETYRASIVGTMKTYGEVINTYDADRQAKGIDYAISQSQAELDQLIEDVRSARNILMGYKEEISIPVVSAALQLECHSMIMANVRDNRLKQAILSYQSWFDDWLANADDSLPALSLEAAEEAKRLLKERSSSEVKFQGSSCIDVNMHFELAPMRATAMDGTRRLITMKPEPPGDRKELQKTAIDVCVHGGLIRREFVLLIPELVSLESVQIALRGDEANSAYQVEVAGTRRLQEFFPAFTGVCTTSLGFLEDMVDERKAQNEEIKLARLRLLALGGFWSAAFNSARFCSTMLKGL